MSKFENLTSKIEEKFPSRAKAKGKRLRKVRQSDDGRTSSEPSSDLESELEEQVRQRKKKQKIRLIPLELSLTRGKNDTKGQVVMNQSMDFEKFKTKMKTYKKLQNCSDLLVKKMQKKYLVRTNECSRS